MRAPSGRYLPAVLPRLDSQHEVREQQGGQTGDREADGDQVDTLDILPCSNIQTLLYTRDFVPRAMKHDTDTIMTVTAFGMFVYSTFTIIAGRDSVTIPSFDGCHETL